MMDNQELRKLVADVVAYNWEREAEDWEENGDPDSPESHIFTTLKRLDQWLGETE